jgi:pimeloyl-ACP methyl ester carboxylesterase
MTGREDNLIPVSEAEDMAKAVPGSRLEVVERAGHLIPLENPSYFQKILKKFCADDN